MHFPELASPLSLCDSSRSAEVDRRVRFRVISFPLKTKQYKEGHDRIALLKYI